MILCISLLIILFHQKTVHYYSEKEIGYSKDRFILSLRIHLHNTYLIIIYTQIISNEQIIFTSIYVTIKLIKYSIVPSVPYHTVENI